MSALNKRDNELHELYKLLAAAEQIFREAHRLPATTNGLNHDISRIKKRIRKLEKK